MVLLCLGFSSFVCPNADKNIATDPDAWACSFTGLAQDISRDPLIEVDVGTGKDWKSILQRSPVSDSQEAKVWDRRRGS